MSIPISFPLPISILFPLPLHLPIPIPLPLPLPMRIKDELNGVSSCPLRSTSVRLKCLHTLEAWTRQRRTMQTMKERSGTTPSQRTTSRRRPTDRLSGCWHPHEQSPRGGPAEGTAGPWRAAAAGQRQSGKVSAAVQAMGIRGMRYIPQRRYICTDRCLRANLRRRGGLPPAKQQVR